MAKVRQDAWSHEDDLLLAETVLRHIREGSTQLNAFEEVGDELNRTSAACGFRWNAEVRNNYIQAIDLAKRHRKEKKRALAGRNFTNFKQEVIDHTNEESQHENILEKEAPSTKISEHKELTFGDVISFLQSIHKNYHAFNQSHYKFEQLQRKTKQDKVRIIELEKELKETKNKLTTIEEDYKMFIQIMDRARKMSVLDEKGHQYQQAPTFKMDKNGNLEQYAHGSN